MPKRTWADGADFDDIDLPEKAERGEGGRERSIALHVAQNASSSSLQNDSSQLHDHSDIPRKRAGRKEQQRGALHVHIACQQFPAYLRNEHGERVKSYALISSMWSRVVGRGNGNVHFTKPRGCNSAHRIASYIAKYVSKKVSEAALNAKSYWSSKDITMPKPERIWYSGDTPTYDIVVQLAKQFALNGYSDIAQYADSMNQFHWFSASKAPTR